MTSKLFLKFMEDSKFHVVDKTGKSYGSDYEIGPAIRQARKKSQAPIDFEESYEGFERLCVTEKPDDAEADHRQFIAALAEIGGMKVIELHDDNLHFLGYRMELIE